MAADTAVALIALGGTTTVAVITILGAAIDRRREQRWRERQAVATVRREAYSRYLIAQQAIRDRLAADSDERAHAWLGSDEGRAAEAWGESGAAEMNARLVASANVFKAIDMFEGFADACTQAHYDETEPPDWETARSTLIEAMRDETTTTWAKRRRRRPSVQRPRVLPIITERLELRAYTPADVPAIHAVLYGDPAVRRFTGGISSLVETQAIIVRYIGAQETHGYAFWAVVERDTGVLVGEAGLKPVGDTGPDVELGYAFGKAYWGRGYATETGRAILGAAFGPLGLKRVVATVQEANTGSRNVLAKLGFSSAGSVVIEGTELLYLAIDERHYERRETGRSASA